MVSLFPDETQYLLTFFNNRKENKTMTSTIWELKETGEIVRRSTYSLPTKSALIAFVMQERKNMNTWEYPNHIDGMRESKIKTGQWYYDMGTSVFSACAD